MHRCKKGCAAFEALTGAAKESLVSWRKCCSTLSGSTLYTYSENEPHFLLWIIRIIELPF